MLLICKYVNMCNLPAYKWCVNKWWMNGWTIENSCITSIFTMSLYQIINQSIKSFHGNNCDNIFKKLVIYLNMVEL